MTPANTPDPWTTGQPYERFMGRWSRIIARLFIQWLSPPPAYRWLEIGCGTGALSETILTHAEPASVMAVDPSDTFIAHAQNKITDKRITFHVGDALHLPTDAHSFDMVVSGLVLNFIPEPVMALQAMRNVLPPDGVIAFYVWDYGGKMEMLRYFWDCAVALDPRAQALDEGVRFPICQPEALTRVCAEAGLHAIEATALEATMEFVDFADYWSPFLGGQGPAPGYVTELGMAERMALEEHLRARLPFREDGSLDLAARAWAVQAIV